MLCVPGWRHSLLASLLQYKMSSGAQRQGLCKAGRAVGCISCMTKHDANFVDQEGIITGAAVEKLYLCNSTQAAAVRLDASSRRGTQACSACRYHTRPLHPLTTMCSRVLASQASYDVQLMDAGEAAGRE
jgi:hypothetical protein